MVQRQAARFVCNDWRTTSNPSKMLTKKIKANPRAQMYRSPVKDWNILPPNIKNETNLEKFEQKLFIKRGI